MHAVVNHLPLQKGIDWTALARGFGEFEAMMRGDYPSFRGGTLIKVEDDKAILIISFDNLEALNDISKNVAAPWFAEHVRPLLADAVSRSVGEVVCGSALR